MARSGRNIWVTVGFAALLAVSGCKQILGLEDRGEKVDADAGDAGANVTATPDGGDAGGEHSNPVVGQCGALSHPSQACADCMDRNCCAEATACHDDPSCSLETDCLFQCGDDGSCRARCNQFYNSSETTLAESACREKACAAECELSCGGLAYFVSGCDTCVRSTCCELASACAKNVECLKLAQCRINCLPGSITCPPQCDSTYSNGVNDYGAWQGCLQDDTACGPKCQSGQNWACLGMIMPWPRPKSAGNLTFSVTIVDLLSEKPYVGSKVKACNKLDALCASPIMESMTDGDGLVSLTVPAGSDGFNGYLDITGGDNGAMSGKPSPVFPALWYPVPPVISPGWRGRLQFVSAADLPVLGALTRADVDPTRGHFAANALDCDLTAAGGVVFSADAADSNTRSFYFANGVPTISATATDPQTAIGGFINLPANQLVYVTATTMDGNKKVGSLAFNIRPGSFTTTSLPPVP